MAVPLIPQPPSPLLSRPLISLPLPGASGCRGGGRVIHDWGRRNAYEHHMSFQLHVLHTYTHPHRVAHAYSDRCGRGVMWCWRRPLLMLAPNFQLCPVLHHWRLCGHRLIYGLLYRNRHAITFIYYRVTEREWAQTNSVLCPSVRSKYTDPDMSTCSDISAYQFSKDSVLMGQLNKIQQQQTYLWWCGVVLHSARTEIHLSADYFKLRQTRLLGSTAAAQSNIYRLRHHETFSQQIS